MCVNYVTVTRQTCFDWFRTPLKVNGEWCDEIYRDYNAPFIVHDEQGRRALKIGGYGFVPQRHRPFMKRTKEEQAKIDLGIVAGKKVPQPKRIAMDTMNARAEEVGSKVNYKRFWLSQQLCIVPAQKVFEPNWENGIHERWALGLADEGPFGLPGIGVHGRKRTAPYQTLSRTSR